MTKTAYIQQIQTRLRQGDLERALKSLEQYAEAFAPKRQNDVTTLKATFSNAKRQFEVKGLMTRPEYDLVFARTVNGIQVIIREEEEDKTLSSTKKTSSKRRISIAIAVSVLLFLILPFLSYRYLAKGNKSLEEPLNTNALDSIVQNNMTIQIPEEVVTEIEKKKPPSQQKEKPRREKETQEKEQPPIVKTTQPTPSIEKQEQTIEKVVEYLEIKLVVNADYSKAQIFVDGKAATILQNTPIIKTIRVEKKADMHHIELKNGDRPCVQNLLLIKDGQKVTMSC